MTTKEFFALPAAKSRFIEPMFISEVPELPERREWVYEAKLDGYTPQRGVRLYEFGAVRALSASVSGRIRMAYERRFCHDRHTSEFDMVFEFVEIKSEKRTEYKTYKVTLHPVAEGTARTHYLDPSEFELPPL